MPNKYIPIIVYQYLNTLYHIESKYRQENNDKKFQLIQ